MRLSVLLLLALALPACLPAHADPGPPGEPSPSYETQPPLHEAPATMVASGVTYPGSVGGADVPGFQRLGWWVDAEGLLHIQGRVGSLGGVSASRLVWPPGTLPASARPASKFWSAPCVTNLSAHGEVFVVADGSLSVGTSSPPITVADIAVVFNPTLAVAP